MKTGFTLLAIVGAAFTTAAIVYIAKGFNQGRRAQNVADEGYETAHDILYPHRNRSSRKLHYGPVLPQE